MRSASVSDFGPPGVGSCFLSAYAAAGAPAHPAYNPWVDRLNAIRLLQVLIAAGASSRAPMNGDWVHEIALRDLSLQVTKLASAIAYAEGEGWFADSPRRKDWICLTRTGEVVAKTAVMARGG